MKENTVNERIPELLEELQAANHHYNELVLIEHTAIANRTTQLNHLNKLQKEFDRCVVRMHDNSAYQSDWRRDR